MKKFVFALIGLGILASTTMSAKAYYDYSYPYNQSYPYYEDYGYDYGYYQPYGYSDYQYYYPYGDSGYQNYSYPYYSPDNYYNYSNGWYNDYFDDYYNDYYNNGWDYYYSPYDYGWNNYWSSDYYDYGWDNNGPMYVWNKNEQNPIFKINNYQNYFNENNIYNYYPQIKDRKPEYLTIKKIEFINKEETKTNIVIDNSRHGSCEINQARIAVSSQTFTYLKETVIKTSDVSIELKPDHKIEFHSPHGDHIENNAAIYFSR